MNEGAGPLTNYTTYQYDGLNRVVGVGYSIGHEYSEEPNLVVVRLFDNHSSAKRYVHPGSPHPPEGWIRHEAALRAIYARDPKGPSEGLTWYADPLNKDTKKLDITLCICGKNPDVPRLPRPDELTAGPR
jgi:hypothetical protein